MSPDMAKEETNEELRDSFDGKERDLPRQRRKGGRGGRWMGLLGGGTEEEAGGRGAAEWRKGYGGSEDAREVVW
jgi:hypothetical protein